MWPAVLALLWAALTAADLVRGSQGQAAFHGVAALGFASSWWASPRPRVRAVTPEALVVRERWHTRPISRTQVTDVQPRYTGGYGLDLTLRDTGPLRLAGTALTYSTAEAQAAALRRWAGLPEVPPVG